jgi:hypothetical protein
LTTSPSGDKIVYLNIAAEFSLTERELWPDGDAPKNWTVRDVVELMESQHNGSKRRTLESWELLDTQHYEVYVTGPNPNGGDLDLETMSQVPFTITKEVWADDRT